MSRSTIHIPSILLLIFAQVANAQEEVGRTIRAAMAETPPVIDGRPDDEAWQQAPVMGDFVQREPRDGAPASEPTEVRVLYDGDALYVAAWLYDSQPSQIVSPIKPPPGTADSPIATMPLSSLANMERHAPQATHDAVRKNLPSILPPARLSGRGVVSVYTVS